MGLHLKNKQANNKTNRKKTRKMLMQIRGVSVRIILVRFNFTRISLHLHLGPMSLDIWRNG